MQRLRKKGMFWLAALLVTSVSLVSCGSVPQLPDTMVCVLDLPRDEAVCAMTSGGKEFRVPLTDMDGSIAFQPEEWGKVRGYIKTLQSYIRDNCAGN